MNALKGTVYLVGAGPGDPGLITVRGRELLATCDAVVVDALANPALLAHCRAGVEVHHAGKRAGQHSATQDEINALLVQLAAGRRSVVRLKGGDPFVFGRGGEEAEALREAGIAYEVVPGVTSAVAAPAAAGIPVTHRDWAGHVTIVTGHEREGEEGRIDYGPLAALLPEGTLVFLMGARSLPRIAQGLLDCGAAAGTPAAAVQWGTDPRQRSVSAPLSGIAAAVEAAGMGSPMVTVVGRVAALRERLAWFEHRPLHGRRIVVTRARAQASGFLERLRSMGADAVELPVIAIEPSAEQADLDAAVRRLAGASDPGGQPAAASWAVFTSANAVDLVWDAVARLGLDARSFAGTRIVAIGPETAAALHRHGLLADIVPTDYVAEAVADAMLADGVDGAHVWLPRAAIARDVLPDRLREAGADVDVLPLYRTVLPADTPQRLHELLDAGPVDAVTFTSSSTVQHFLSALDGRPFPSGAIAACIGPITARTAADAGLPVAIVATAYTTAGLAAALAAHFSSGR
ncbi:MAG TPA: uroporphyrinogen-III C-methyltransferase [Candidatus Dormibacteraeota bacterium]|nr:uroporphyrinogen-III C-methyltransferase [Candidatus Dormibacteraeota bacterium]